MLTERQLKWKDKKTVKKADIDSQSIKIKRYMEI